MVNSNDLISVIVPVYNAETYLRQCIDSLVSQTYENIEIVLVDDGSTDSSGKICDDYSASPLSSHRNIHIFKGNVELYGRNIDIFRNAIRWED